MHTVELLESAVALADACGFAVRRDWLAGAGSGVCQLKGRRYLLIELGLPPEEQLEIVLRALRTVADAGQRTDCPQLRHLLASANAA